jgi:competence protein ComGC
MQRKNSILMPLKSSARNVFHRKMFTERRNNFRGTKNIRNHSGFAMIMAVAVIIVVSTIMLLSLNTTALTSKRTVDLYLHEQAELHTKSAIEYALYKIATEGCQNNLNIPALDGVYDINISMRYIGTSSSGCTDYINNLTTEEQNGSVLMDVTVTIPTSVTGAEEVRFFRRTIQKL